jgi:hypothetical protein
MPSDSIRDVDCNPTLRCHWDADGITSAHFASFGIENSKVEVGNCEKEFGDTTGLTRDDYILDMRPSDPNWEGNCIDHHLPHPEDRKYSLISEVYPATLITWKHFKDKIPKNEWFKIAVGLAGDGQPELIPNEVFQACPALLRRIKTSAYKSNYSRKWSVNKLPMYKLLSSGINALLRKGEYDIAYGILKSASSPQLLYNSEDARIAKLDIQNDLKTSISDSEIVTYGNLGLILYKSRYRMSGYVATVMEEALGGRTVMAINKRNGSLSLRGDLASYYKEKLKPLDYLIIDGHVKYMGGKLKKNYLTLLDDLDNIL